jgi:hypothetical protein
MAKAKSAAINVSEAVRAIIQANPKISAVEAREQLGQQHPTLKINTNSFGVAFYTARKKLGIKTGGKSVAKKVARVAHAAGATVSFEALKHAAALLRAAGNPEAAIEAIKTVQAVQID